MDPVDLTAMANGATDLIPFIGRSGFEVLEAEPGRCVARMPLEGNGNHVGTMYAGALFTLAEVPGGVVALSTFDPAAYYPIIKGMEIQFRRPATTDVTVEVSLAADEVARIRTEADEHGKADWSWSSELRGADGEVVATTQNHYQLRRTGT